MNGGQEPNPRPLQRLTGASENILVGCFHVVALFHQLVYSHHLKRSALSRVEHLTHGIWWLFAPSVSSLPSGRAKVVSLHYPKYMSNTFWSDLVTQATGGLIGGAIGGAIGGSVVLLVQRFLNSFGKIEGAVRQKNVDFRDTTSGTPQPATHKSSANEVWYAFTVRFYNGKPLNTGLRDIRVVFERAGAGGVPHTPYDPDKPQSEGSFASASEEYEEVDLINLPSGQWVVQRLRGRLEAQLAREAAQCDKVVLVGYLSNNKELRVPLVDL